MAETERVDGEPQGDNNPVRALASAPGFDYHPTNLNLDQDRDRRHRPPAHP